MIPDNPNCQPNLETIFNLSRFFRKKRNTFISTETNACCIAYLRFSNSYKTEKTECFLCVVLLGDGSFQARSLLGLLMLMGVIVGFSVGCMAISVPWFFPQIFTKDLAIISQMQSVTLPLFCSLVITPPTHALEGTLLAGRDMKFLGLSMTSCFCGGSILLLTCHKLGWGLQGSWWTLAAFQWARFAFSYARLSSSQSILRDPIDSYESEPILTPA
jgi:hypothetical protein